MSRPVQRKILQVFQPAVGGVPRYVSSLAGGLLRRGWDVTVAAPADSIGLDEIRAAGGDVVPLAIERSPKAGADRAAVQRLVGLIRRRDIDLVHGHSSKAGGLAALAGRTAGVPSVYTPHAWAFQMRNPLLIRAALAGGEAALVRLHERRRDRLRRRGRRGATVARGPRGPHPRGPHRTRPASAPTPDRAAARRRLGLPTDDVVVGWIGRDGPSEAARGARRPRAARPAVGDHRGARPRPAERCDASSPHSAAPGSGSWARGRMRRTCWRRRTSC